MHTMMMRANITAYSTAVGPSSETRKRCNFETRFLIAVFLKRDLRIRAQLNLTSIRFPAVLKIQARDAQSIVYSRRELVVPVVLVDGRVLAGLFHSRVESGNGPQTHLHMLVACCCRLARCGMDSEFLWPSRHRHPLRTV